jgi:hypothetical protein
MTLTSGQLINGFLAHRAATVTARTLARDRLVLDRFSDRLDADGPCLLDDATGRRLSRDQGGVGLSDLVDVDLIIMGMRGFLDGIVEDDERRRSALVLRQLVSYLVHRRELDECCALSLLQLTREHAPVAARARRPRARPRWR